MLLFLPTVTATQSKASTTAPVVPERTEANQTGSLPGIYLFTLINFVMQGVAWLK